MRIAVKGVGFDRVTLGEAADRCRELMEDPGGHYVVTPNPEIVWLARKMPELKTALNGADLVVPDGIGIIYGARILGTPLKERVPGIERRDCLSFSWERSPALRNGRGRSLWRSTAVCGSSAAETDISKRTRRFWPVSVSQVHV